MRRSGKAISKRIISLFAAGIFALGLAAGNPDIALADDIDMVEPGDVTMDEDGTVSWEEPTTPGYEVDKYEVEVYRERDGEFTDKVYRSKTVRDDTECSFSLGYITRYRARVKAIYIGGRESDWSDYSNIVSVSKDDLNSGGGSSHDGPPANWNRPYNPGPGVVGTQPSGGTVYPGTVYGPSQGTGYGWVQAADGRYWYKNYDGSYPANRWESINGKWYYFDGQGYMATGWVWYNNSWYLCLPDGQMATGWRNVNEKWYYLNESGVMLTGMQQIDGKTYYLDSTGARVSNTTTPDGHVLDANGVMVS